MSVPAKRLSRSKGRRRRSQQGRTKALLSTCPQCGRPIMSHRACGFCGYYKGQAAVKIKTKANRTAGNKKNKS